MTAKRETSEFCWVNHTSEKPGEPAMINPVAMLPIGAIAQHGTCLPLAVDIYYLGLTVLNLPSNT